MHYPDQRIQIDVNVVPHACIAKRGLKLYQYTSIDEYSRHRILGAYSEQSTYSSTDFLWKVVAAFALKGVKVECVQTINSFECTIFSLKAHSSILSICDSRKLTYKTASELCNLSSRYFSSIARGQAAPSINTLEKLFVVFDRTPNELPFFSPLMKNSPTASFCMSNITNSTPLSIVPSWPFRSVLAAIAI